MGVAGGWHRLTAASAELDIADISDTRIRSESRQFLSRDFLAMRKHSTVGEDTHGARAASCYSKGK
jgi:hypothetical protein